MTSARAIFLSDIHLGTAVCQARRLAEFLERWDAPCIYLVGDIIDLWAMRRRLHWPNAHNAVIQTLLERAQKGVEIILVPGNHDAGFRALTMHAFGNISVKAFAEHRTLDGDLLLVIHGDIFDPVEKYPRILAASGRITYRCLMWAQPALGVLSTIGVGKHFSVSAFVRSKLARVRSYISEFENCALRYAADSGYQGIICGHIHQANMSSRDGISYFNCGDWVGSCTALVEHEDGRFEIFGPEFSEPCQRGSEEARPPRYFPVQEVPHPCGASPPDATPAKNSSPG